MKKTIGKTVDKFVDFGLVEASDKDLFAYGFRLAILMFINAISIILIGIAFNMFVNSVIFLIMFLVIRSYSGGFHASGPKRCYFYSLVLIMITFYIMKRTIGFHIIWLIAFIASTVIIFLLSPVEAKNKSLTAIEKKVFGRKTKIILNVLTIVNISSYCLNLMGVFSSITSALILDALLLVVEKYRIKFVLDNPN
ncbi:accessory gene regulator B family protein [Eubacteriaceae bacterium ES2]|nr:accessory gene regulator B family protein [Eubacteriaceae bacterium ES2]